MQIVFSGWNHSKSSHRRLWNLMEELPDCMLRGLWAAMRKAFPPAEPEPSWKKKHHRTTPSITLYTLSIPAHRISQPGWRNWDSHCNEKGARRCMRDHIRPPTKAHQLEMIPPANGSSIGNLLRGLDFSANRMSSCKLLDWKAYLWERKLKTYRTVDWPHIHIT